jgi:ATP-binding protein involved in chromosome partitioning
MVKRDAVWTALGSVIHPTFGLSLVTLEMVKDVRVDGDAVTVELRLDCPGCPGAEAALAQVSRKLRALNPAPGLVTVSLAAEKWSPPWEGYWFTSGID